MVVGVVLIAFVAGAAWIGAASADDASKVPNGKPVFEKYKCTSCHSIDSQGIKKKKPAEGEVEEKDEGGRVPPDLSGVGVGNSAEWIAKYIQKLEMLDGKKHGKKFRGTESELKTLTGWLASLKDEAAAKKAQEARKAAAAKGEAAKPAATEK